MQQFAQLKGEDRRAILRNLSDEEYENVMKVLGRMPYIDFQVRSEGNILLMFDYKIYYLFWFSVIDDENPTEVTAGAIVTVTVTLIRKDMSTLFGDETVPDALPINDGQREEKGDGDGDTGK